MKLRKYLKEKVGFAKYPKGWDRTSVMKFGASLTDETGLLPSDHGWFDACVRKMGDKLDDPQAFCASVRDEVMKSAMWRGKGKEAEKLRAKSKKEVQKVLKKEKKGK